VDNYDADIFFSATRFLPCTHELPFIAKPSKRFRLFSELAIEGPEFSLWGRIQGKADGSIGRSRDEGCNRSNPSTLTVRFDNAVGVGSEGLLLDTFKLFDGTIDS
jgi:hypothetical protein